MSKIEVLLKGICKHQRIIENEEINSKYPCMIEISKYGNLTIYQKIGKILLRNNEVFEELNDLLYKNVYSEETKRKYKRDGKYGKGMDGFIEYLKEFGCINILGHKILIHFKKNPI